MTDETKEIYGVIYKATDPNGKCYIGQHKGDGSTVGKTYFGSGTYVKRAIVVHGKDYFNYALIEACSSREELDDREKHYIKFFNSFTKDNGYNIHEGGTGGDVTLGMSDEELTAWKERLSIAQKIAQNRPETKKKNSDTHKIYQNLPEVRKKNSEAQLIAQNKPEQKKRLSELGKIAQNRPEVKQRNADAQRGRKHSEETKAKMSASGKGRIFTEEHRANISKATLGRKDSEQARRNKSIGHMGVYSCANKTEEEMKELNKKRSEDMKIFMNRPEIIERQKYGAHKQHHVDKNILNPNCKFCMESK